MEIAKKAALIKPIALIGYSLICRVSSGLASKHYVPAGKVKKRLSSLKKRFSAGKSPRGKASRRKRERVEYEPPNENPYYPYLLSA
ncbi:hypothetical protein [Mixta gaviniae]|uniref:hypothetical protein n=1 Tax=Mixta gaviniae TaxID=665914 RepID=UPI0010080CBE|nr:hypothetical protein [Mixta gaviniae]